MSNVNPRTFPIQNATVTAQPILATSLVSDIAPCAINAVYQGTGGQNVEVDDSSIFQVGDYVNIVPVAGQTTPQEEIQVPVTAIPDSSHIVILNSAPHNAGDWVVLSQACAQVRFQELKGAPPAGSLFIGTDLTVDASGNFSFEDLSVDFTFVTPIRPGNSDNSAAYTIISPGGTTSYIVSLWQN